MKTMKRIMALLICFVMVMGMTVTAFAYDVTITRNDTDKSDKHSYVAYQIFSGDLDTDGKKLSNIQWGTGINQSKLSDLRTTINILAGNNALTESSTANDYAESIAKLNSDETKVKKLAAAIGAALSETTSGTSTANGVTSLDAGYYLIKDTGNLADENGAYTRFMLQVVKDTTVTQKASVPSVEKKVKDTDDSTNTTTGLQDSADYDIGDEVPFQLTATTASTVSDYTKYHVTFQDKQSDGLDAPTDFTIEVLGKKFTLSSSVTTENATTDNGTKITVEKVTTPDTGCTFAIKVTLENSTTGEKINEEANSTKIKVTYTSKLNNNAEIGATGNPNVVYLKYSNNPNSTDDSEEGKTPTDKVVVFTYEATVNKVDEKSKPLVGAEFKLYKKVKTGSADKLGSAIAAALKNNNSSINTDGLELNSYYEVVKQTSSTATSFTWKGIDDGAYVLVETKIPDGYNAFVSKSFTVSAEHDTSSDDPKLTSLTVSDSNLLTADYSAGTLSGNIVNNSGSTLPSTGGIGTRIFYIIGGILMAAAAVVLITKVRYKKEK